ncbi:MAG: PucR family transcriptional regulator [Roseburia sp.]
MTDITFEDLLELPILKKCRLVAGTEGIRNRISWPYVVLSTTILGWVSGYEIAIYAKDSEASFEQQIAVYRKLLTEANESHVSAIIISLRDDMTGLPEEVLSLSNQYRIPLLEAPWNISSIDFTKAIINYIIRHQRQDTLPEEFVRGMLFGTEADRDRNVRLLPSTASRLPSYFVINCVHHKNPDYHACVEESKAITYEYIMPQVKRYLSFSFEHLSSSVIDDSAVYILSAENYSRQTLSPLLSKISSALTLEYPALVFHLGVSRRHRNIRELDTAYREACISAKYRNFLSSKTECFTYADECSGLLLLSGLSNDTLIRYYEQVLGKLVSEHTYSYQELLLSLKCYIRCNYNLTQAAGELFVHKNTLRNRLARIEELTCRDLSRAQDLYDITTALLAYDIVQGN